MLEFTIAREHSTLPEVLVPALEQLLGAAKQAGDAGRLMHCRALLTRYFGWFFGGDAGPRCQAPLPPADAVLHPSAAVLWALFWADTLSYRGDNSGMLERFAEDHRLALLSGQGQLAAAAGAGVKQGRSGKVRQGQRE